MISTMVQLGRVLICDMPPGDCAAPSWRDGTRSIGKAAARAARKDARIAGWSRITLDGFKFDLCPSCTTRRERPAGTAGEEV